MTMRYRFQGQVDVDSSESRASEKVTALFTKEGCYDGDLFAKVITKLFSLVTGQGAEEKHLTEELCELFYHEACTGATAGYAASVSSKEDLASGFRAIQRKKRSLGIPCDFPNGLPTYRR